MTVIEEIALERRRQGEVEGFSDEDDDLSTNFQLSRAAAIYATYAKLPRRARLLRDMGRSPTGWPWDSAWFKPIDPRRDLVRAAALIVAEIERLDRAAEKTERPA